MSTTAKRHAPSPRSPIYCATADPDTPTIESGASQRGAVARQHLRRSVGLAADRSHAASSGAGDCSADTQGARAPVTQRRAIIGDDDHDPAC